MDTRTSITVLTRSSRSNPPKQLNALPVLLLGHGAGGELGGNWGELGGNWAELWGDWEPSSPWFNGVCLILLENGFDVC